MSTSALSGILAQQQIGVSGNPYQQQIQQLGQALQSGNLSAAQSDFATLQQAFTQSSTTSGTASTVASSPVSQSLNQLSSDLQSGNLAAAQKDFSTIQQRIKGIGTPTPSHFLQSHHFGGGADPAEPNSLLQELNQLGQSLSTTNPTAAQQAYSTLQQQFQQFALGSEDSSEISNLPVSLVA
jgi:hypothetical protein